MIFDGNALSKISNEEIARLVKEHLGERQHLEYKLTINRDSDDDIFEVLFDITSLANAGGGYLIVGIRDDGKGKAQIFESVNNPDRVKQSILSLCIDHITERIEGLEVECRKIDGNDTVIVRIPSSIRIPHMVKYQNHTHFVTRYYDGKREMTIGEIHAAFTEDFFGRKLALIEDGIRSVLDYGKQSGKEALRQQIISGEVSILSIEDGNQAAELYQQQVIDQLNDKPFFYISITPANTQRGLVDVESTEIYDLFRNPPNQRDTGWTMKMFASSVQQYGNSLYSGKPGERLLTLFQNGHMEFYCLLDTLFCWMQNEEQFKKQPRLYPYAVAEYPCSFLRLYKGIIERLNFHGSYIIKMRYQNLHGYIAVPYRPDNVVSLINLTLIKNMAPQPYQKQHLVVQDLTVEGDYNPDKTTYDLLKQVYSEFGYSSDMIPFYDRNMETFNIGM
jgi:hypothetical protein